MKSVLVASQLLIALTLLNVWLFRRRQATAWRGGAARNMSEEFQVYGLPPWFMLVTGSLKVSLAAGLILGALYPALVQPVAVAIAGLMLGAIAMHFKVADPLRKSLPAFSLFVLSAFVAVASLQQ